MAATWAYAWEALVAADAIFRGRGCNLLGMVGFSFNAQNGGVDILELFGECQLDQKVGGGKRSDCRASIAAQHV